MTKTFDTFSNEHEAEVACNYFTDCGCAAKRKGKTLKVTGEEAMIEYLYHKFIFNVLLGT